MNEVPEIWTHEEIDLANNFAKTLTKFGLCRGYGKSEKWEYGKIIYRKPTFLGNEVDDEDDDW